MGSLVGRKHWQRAERGASSSHGDAQKPFVPGRTFWLFLVFSCRSAFKSLLACTRRFWKAVQAPAGSRSTKSFDLPLHRQRVVGHVSCRLSEEQSLGLLEAVGCGSRVCPPAYAVRNLSRSHQVLSSCLRIPVSLQYSTELGRMAWPCAMCWPDLLVADLTSLLEFFPCSALQASESLKADMSVVLAASTLVFCPTRRGSAPSA